MFTEKVPGHAVLAPSHLRVLLAVLYLYKRNGYAGVRSVQHLLGHKSPHSVDASLKKLKRLGLIDWGSEQPEGARHGGNTIVPRCYLKVFKDETGAGR